MPTVIETLLYNVNHRWNLIMQCRSQSKLGYTMSTTVEVGVCNINRSLSQCMHCQPRLKLGPAMSTMIKFWVCNFEWGRCFCGFLTSAKVLLCSDYHSRSLVMQCQLWLKYIYVISTAVEVGLCNVDRGQSWCLHFQWWSKFRCAL